MKQALYAATAALAIFFASCSSGTEPKKINPTSTDFTKGDIAKYVEVVDEPCELTYTTREGWVEEQIFRLNVKLKLTKVNEDLKGIDFRDIELGGWNAAELDLVDETGAAVQDLKLDEASELNLKKLLAGNVGDIQEVVFEGSFANSEDAPEWYKQAAKFTPTETGYIRNTTSVTTSTQTTTSTNAVVEKAAPEVPAFSAENVKLPSSLKGKVEVVEVSKYVSSYGYPAVSITFKLLKTVNTQSLCSEYGQMWIIGVGQTKKGTNVRELLPNYEEWRSDDSDGNQFKTFLEGEPGETICMEFTGDKENSSNVATDLEKVETFKLSITK